MIFIGDDCALTTERTAPEPRNDCCGYQYPSDPTRRLIGWMITLTDESGLAPQITYRSGKQFTALLAGQTNLPIVVGSVPAGTNWTSASVADYVPAMAEEMACQAKAFPSTSQLAIPGMSPVDLGTASSSRSPWHWRIEDTSAFFGPAWMPHYGGQLVYYSTSASNGGVANFECYGARAAL